MSYEHFETPCTVDMRTAPNGRDVEYGRPGSGNPRWLQAHDRQFSWVAAHPYAHMLMDIAAAALRDEPMTGITGDHPARREATARLCEQLREVIKALAADAACDGTLTDERWTGVLHDLVNEALAAQAVTR